MNTQAVTKHEERSLSVQLKERGISASEWHTLTKSLYPGAQQASVLLVVDYCRARKLDPMKKPCHIVPMKVGDKYQDVVMPGIYELRTTAQRTGEYLGHSKPAYGPMIEYKGVSAPEWCSMVIYRWNPTAKQKCEYPVEVYFAEVCGETWDKKAKKYVVNSRWKKAPRQMLTKCTEAAGHREAFPDEIGGEMSAEEMMGDYIDESPQTGPVTLSSITGDEPIDGEVVEPEPPNKDVEFTPGDIKSLIDLAKSKDDIDEAMDLVNTVPKGEEHDKLKRAALDKYQAIMG